MNNSRSNQAQNPQQNNGGNQQNNITVPRINGLGYVRDLKEHQSPEDGSYFTTCTVAAIDSTKNSTKPQYSYIHVFVVGDEAQDLIWQYQEAIRAKRKVLIQFRMSGIQAKGYLTQKGEARASLNSNLYAIEKIWLEQDLVYTSAQANGQEAFPAGNNGNYQNGQQQGGYYQEQQQAPNNGVGSRSTGGYQSQGQPSQNQYNAQQHQGQPPYQPAPSGQQGGSRSRAY